ncbi:hypothetical protein BJ878DRAFT_490554 [Calycina marina]|uniref:RING zinc finger-like domain-containing protein n=1 Tax=Calycina marina TaxID=1763456 RepID=A0A9P7ZAG1_9HELO|nr:hypothetical protein BJ878DRAFT_490554 [Calycina marina]
MQEHIRRAHPEHYISKLPATEESFQLMISTPPSERPPTLPPTNNKNLGPQGYGSENHGYYREGSSAPNTPRNLDEYLSASMLPAASAAAALTSLSQLHNPNYKGELDWELEGVSDLSYSSMNEQLTLFQDWMSDTEARKQAMRNSIELPPIPNNFEPTSEPYSHLNRRRELLPSILPASPPGRSSTLPPIQKTSGPARPRKQSVSKHAREPQHRRQKSKGNEAHLRRMSYERKAFSAEPTSSLSAAYGKRWEDLIDAATSATEEDEERTPVPQSPIPINRASVPPFSASHFQGYQASPLQQALTPPSYFPDAPEPFPSVESGESADIFNIGNNGLSDSSPSFTSQQTQIYCAACQGISLLKESYACTECICGICQACVDVLMAEQGARRKCPRCAIIGGRFKPFQLDIR